MGLYRWLLEHTCRHREPVRDRAHDGTPVWRCERCGLVRDRDVSDIRMKQPNDPRFRMSRTENARRRWEGLRSLRDRQKRTTENSVKARIA